MGEVEVVEEHKYFGVHISTAGKMSIEHVNISLKKHISNQAIDMKFSPDVGINPSNAHIQRNPNIYVQKIKLCVIKWNCTGNKYWTHEEKEG